MNRQERFKIVYEYLRAHGKVQTQKGFGLAIGKTEGVISKAMKGDEKSLTDNIFQDIFRTYKPVFNYDWLLSGEGEMLDEPLPDIVPHPRKTRVARRNASLAYNLPSDENNAQISAPMASDGVLRSSDDASGDAPSIPDSTQGSITAIAEMYSKAQKELTRISAVKSDTEKANREAHALLSELVASRTALDAARADFLSARNDLQSAVVVMRQLITRVTDLLVRGEFDGMSLAAEPRPSINDIASRATNDTSDNSAPDGSDSRAFSHSVNISKNS